MNSTDAPATDERDGGKPLETLVEVMPPPDRKPGTAHGSTTIPERVSQGLAPEVQRTTATLRRTDTYAVVGASVAALSLTTIIFTQLAPFNGVVGFVFVAFVAFIGFYALLVSLDEDGPTVQDRVMGALAHSLGFLLLAALVLVIVFTFARGWRAMIHLNFYTDDSSAIGPLDPLTTGGIAHAIVGTLESTGIALAATVPLAIICAVFLNEIPGRFARLVRTIVEAMTALPSIVAALFIYATVILTLGFDRSAIVTSMGVAVMMLPIIIRAGDVVIRLVPGNLQEAALALGATQWRTVWHVVLPTARSGLTTAVILGTARGIGETSPALLLAGGSETLDIDPSAAWTNTLPLYTFKSVASPSAEMIIRGFGSAGTLMVLVLLLFLLARIIGGRGPGQLTQRQLQARTRASADDQDRFRRRAAARRTAPSSPLSDALDSSADKEKQTDHG